jgi:hypothetical protein
MAISTNSLVSNEFYLIISRERDTGLFLTQGGIMSVQAICPEEKDLTREFLQTVLDYDPDTGYFTWKDTKYSKKLVRVGSRAEHVMIEKTGHLAVDLFPRSFSASRLAIIYMTGYHPRKTPRHLNNDNSDNSIKNLQWEDPSEQADRGKANTFKFPFNMRHVPIFDNEIEYLHGLLGEFLQEHGHYLNGKWSK